jgi:hypothetical protein
LIEQLEGAFLLSRAMRTTEPMELAGAAMAASVQAAIPRREARSRNVTAR